MCIHITKSLGQFLKEWKDLLVNVAIEESFTICDFPVLKPVQYLKTLRMVFIMGCWFHSQVKLNTDQDPSIATEYGIRSIPTVIIFKDGKKLDTVIGAVAKSTLHATIERYVD